MPSWWALQLYLTLRRFNNGLLHLFGRGRDRDRLGVLEYFGVLAFWCQTIPKLCERSVHVVRQQFCVSDVFVTKGFERSGLRQQQTATNGSLLAQRVCFAGLLPWMKN